jgi:hypothetical protein
LAQDNGVKGNQVMRIEGQVQPFLIIARIAAHAPRVSNQPMPIMQHRKTSKDFIFQSG